jgi:hypothetical protein
MEIGEFLGGVDLFASYLFHYQLFLLSHDQHLIW